LARSKSDARTPAHGRQAVRTPNVRLLPDEMIVDALYRGTGVH